MIFFFLSLVMIVLFCNVFSPPFPSPLGKMPGKSPGSHERDYPGFPTRPLAGTALGHGPADGVHNWDASWWGFALLNPTARGRTGLAVLPCARPAESRVTARFRSACKTPDSTS